MGTIGDLRNSLIISTCMHVGMLLFLFFGFPNIFRVPPPASQWRPVPVDIVEIGAITNTNIGKDESDEARSAAMQPKPTPPPPAPEVKPPEPVKPAVLAPEPPAQKEEEGLAPPKPEEKPKPPEPAKPKQPQADPLASVLKNVAKLKPQPAPAAIEGPPTGGKAGVEGGPKGFGPVLSDRLTISAEDALRRQISSCWNMPIGARNAENLVVEVLIEVSPDRTVKDAQIVDQTRMATDPFFRAAAESALRALRHPKCSPLELPEDLYEQWKTIRFNFDPRDML